jgi:hypothetical protein
MNHREGPTTACDTHECNRRDWLRASARYSVLGGVALATGYLVLGRTGSRCGKNLACAECAALSACNLPDAERTRKETAAKAARYASSPIPNP